MSVYRDTNTDVVFEHPYQGALTATVKRGDDVILTQAGITSSGGRFTLPLTYNHTQYDGKLKITWTGASDFSRVQYVDVVTPLVSLSRIRTLFEGENKSDAELTELETAVRTVIQAYTGQQFGFSVGSRTYVGTGGTQILLDQRINRIDDFSGGWVGGIKAGADGWALTIIPDNLLTVKMAPPEEFLTYVTHGVIRIPDYYIKRFNNGATYTLTGEWGYDTVPAEVQEAAMLLANDFACNEVVYRDRYLEAVKIGQDTLTYHTGAFRGTGNVRADLLLGKFRRSGMVII